MIAGEGRGWGCVSVYACVRLCTCVYGAARWGLCAYGLGGALVSLPESKGMRGSGNRLLWRSWLCGCVPSVHMGVLAPYIQVHLGCVWVGVTGAGGCALGRGHGRGLPGKSRHLPELRTPDSCKSVSS